MKVVIDPLRLFLSRLDIPFAALFYSEKQLGSTEEWSPFKLQFIFGLCPCSGVSSTHL